MRNTRSVGPSSGAGGSSSRRPCSTMAAAVRRRAARLLPILHWLPAYNWREQLFGDAIGGFTVGIMHVPQGMAYASLAGVPPIVGLYSSFFASTVYMFFGTAKHISIGTFAVASMMTGAALHGYTQPAGSNNTLNETGIPSPTIEDYASALTLCCAFVQLAMGILPLAFLTTYLSDQLISGYTTGSALHVFTSQLPKALGIHTEERDGIFLLPKSWYDIGKALPQTNLVTLAISVCGIVFLYLGKKFLNPLVQKRLRVPLPLELLLVILGTVVSVIFHLHEREHVTIVDTIPRGFPKPALPKFSLLPTVLPDAVPIAVICIVFVLSMGKIYAKKHRYRTEPDQVCFIAVKASEL